MLNSKHIVRVNGRGNAWPVPLGETHPFYDVSNYEDLANASFSIIKFKTAKQTAQNIEWELLIDAGHGVAQYLLRNSNRIPDAIMITHPHIDHTLGIDWVIQSFFRKHKSLYPVYATAYCWEVVQQTFPHLVHMVDFQELVYGECISLFNEISCTPYPSYHGKTAFGASMLLIQLNGKRILFTGDILVPMLREKDLDQLNHADLLVVDANNRFPFPKSNHWSVAASSRFAYDDSYYVNWLENFNPDELILPHLHKHSAQKVSAYLNEWRTSFQRERLFTSVFHFVEILQFKHIWLVHYSGKEDQKYHNHSILSDNLLTSWSNNSKPELSQDSEFKAVRVGDTYII